MKVKVKKMGFRIVVLQRGWVLAGTYKRKGEYVYLTNAYCIRKWGTSTGLGEIAKDGPTTNTVLDKCEDVIFNVLTEIFSMSCDEQNWKKFIK